MRIPGRARCYHAGTKGGASPCEHMPPGAAEAITFERDYRGTIDQAQHVRADLAQMAASCPVLNDLVLLASDSLNLANCFFGPFWRCFLALD